MPPATANPKYRTVAFREMQHWVIQRDKNRCGYCGETGHKTDFIIPLKHGGAFKPTNMICCCFPCWRASSDAPYPTFADKVLHIIQTRIPLENHLHPSNPSRRTTPEPPPPLTGLKAKLAEKYRQKSAP